MSIRFATLADVSAMLSVYAPYVRETAYSFEYEPPTLEEFTRRFISITTQFPWLVWEENGQVLGYAYGSAPFTRAAYSWCAEVSIYLAPQMQGRGIGKSLYAALEDLLDKQGYHLIYAIVTSQNTASLAFHQAVGYKIFANFPNCAYKFGKNFGITWLEKRLKPIENPSNFPMPITAVVKSDKN